MDKEKYFEIKNIKGIILWKLVNTVELFSAGDLKIIMQTTLSHRKL